MTKYQRFAFLQHFPKLQGLPFLLFRIYPKIDWDLLIEAFAGMAASDPLLRLLIAGPDQVGWQTALSMAELRSKPRLLSVRLMWGPFCGSQLFCRPSHQKYF